MNAQKRDCGRRITRCFIGLLLAVVVGYAIFAGPIVAWLQASTWADAIDDLINGALGADISHSGSREHVYPIVGRIAVTRVCIVLCWIWGAAMTLLHHRTLGRRLYAFLSQPDSAYNLAAARIVMFLLVYQKAAVIPSFVATVDQALLDPPLGVGWIIELIPPETGTVTTLSTLLQVAALFATLGILTRITAPMTAILAIYVLCVPNLFGKVNHYHQILWIPLILSASPCGDALSVDAVIARIRGQRGWVPQRSTAYGTPLRAAALTLGIIYFFPGLWKLWAAGFDWFSAENMRLMLWHKWAERPDWLPPFRIDGHPMLLWLTGFGTILLELSFIVLMGRRWTRTLAVVAGVGFHASVMIFMNINFYTLVCTYVVLIDWAALFGIVKRRETPAVSSVPLPGKPGLAVLLVTGVLMAGNLFMGVTRNSDGWPFACHPTFAARRWSENVDIVTARAVTAQGEQVSIDFLSQLRARLRTSRAYKSTRSVLFERDQDEKARRLQGLWKTIESDIELPSGARAIRFYRARRSLNPDAPPNDELVEILYEIPL